MEEVVFRPIGYIQSNYKTLEEIPRQSILAEKERARIIIREELQAGLTGLDEFEHIIVLFYFHKSRGYKLLVHPRDRGGTAGVFASRSPNRPNGIGLSIVRLVSIKENIIEIEGVDMLDGTPVLDLKPYNRDLNPKD